MLCGRARDGRVSEKLRPNYTPARVKNFDAEAEWRRLHELIRETEKRAENEEVTAELRREALAKEHAAKDEAGRRLNIRSARTGCVGCEIR